MANLIFEVPDGRGLPVQLTEMVWSHIVTNHLVMLGEEDAVRLAISDPDIVARSPKSKPLDPAGERRINARRDAHSRYSNLYLWVPIEYSQKRNWVVTAYPNVLPPKGKYIYVRWPPR